MIETQKIVSDLSGDMNKVVSSNPDTPTIPIRPGFLVRPGYHIKFCNDHIDVRDVDGKQLSYYKYVDGAFVLQELENDEG